jgi:hypothetical protein
MLVALITPPGSSSDSRFLGYFIAATMALFPAGERNVDAPTFKNTDVLETIKSTHYVLSTGVVLFGPHEDEILRGKE